MEVEQKDEQQSEPESEKKRRYLDESSDVELSMAVHHHNDMEVDEGIHNEPPTSSNLLNLGAQLRDMVAARDSARQVYEERRVLALERNDLDELDALERSFEWLHFL